MIKKYTVVEKILRVNCESFIIMTLLFIIKVTLLKK